MNASSESGLWAIEIVRISEEEATESDCEELTKQYILSTETGQANP
jgi:hypothetical protein